MATTQTSYLSFFLHKCTFWAQFFSTFKHINCGKISQPFPKISQHFPNFPLLRERAQYSMHCNVEDEKSLKDMCTKVFPFHNSLTPGLMIMTCACPQKIVYGFSLMTSSESPQMIFDVIMSRFPQNYSPQIIYDNACKFKEFGLNRETRRFKQI